MEAAKHITAENLLEERNKIMEKVNENERHGGTMQKITIYIYHTGAPDDPSKLTDTLVDRIEYAGQAIEFEDGEIRITPMVETIEKPARRGRCIAWQECILKYWGECEHGCIYMPGAQTCPR